MFMFLRNFVKMYYIYWRVSIGTFALEGVPLLPHTSIALSYHKNNSILLLQQNWHFPFALLSFNTPVCSIVMGCFVEKMKHFVDVIHAGMNSHPPSRNILRMVDGGARAPRKIEGKESRRAFTIFIQGYTTRVELI